MDSPSERLNRNEWQRRWRANNPERAKEIDRASRLRRRDKINAYHRARYVSKRTDILAERRQYFAALKRKAYEAYGGYRCRCCGVTTEAFLCIDHMENDGHSHRKQIGRGNWIYRWLAENSYPSGFQILCFNCNQGRRLNNGICPHVEAQYQIVIHEV